jgi:NAD(P)-dependent dehydrogenase (short-subunit alcohol dehydrogenase family)
VAAAGWVSRLPSALSTRGAYVYITGRRQAELDKAVSSIGHGVAAVQGDVSNLADLDRLYAKIAAEKGKIDILFAGAGIVDPQPLAEATEESFDKVFAINVRGLAFTVRKALPLISDGGAIIAIASIAHSKGFPGLPLIAPPRLPSVPLSAPGRVS